MSASTTPAGQSTVRLHNLRLFVGSLLAAPGSRAELAQRTGLTKATVSSLVDSLIAGGVVLEGQPEVSGPGRPARELSFSRHGPLAIGVEINVDYTAVCAVDLTNELRSYSRVEMDNRRSRGDRLFAVAAEMCTTLIDELGQPALGVGLALPAAVGPGGDVLRAPNLPRLNGVNARERLRQAMGRGLGVQVDNEANLAALAELRLQLAGGQNFVYVSGEIGVGAGLVIDGEIFRGVNGFAGELGHVVVERTGPSCGCGGRGCVEQYAGQEVLLRTAAEPDLDGLQRAVAVREVRAVDAVARAGSALGVGVASLLNVLDLPTVILGGLYARLYEVLAPPLQAELSTRVLDSAHGGPRVVRSRLGGDAAVRGAAGAVLEQALREPELLLR